RLLAPRPGLTHLHHILDQLCTQLVHPFIDRRFDLCPCGFGVFFPPLGHPQHVAQSCTHLSHLLTALPFVLLRFHALVSLLIFSCILPPPSFVQKNATHPGRNGRCTGTSVRGILLVGLGTPACWRETVRPVVPSQLNGR